jgi:hypothetical protein
VENLKSNSNAEMCLNFYSGLVVNMGKGKFQTPAAKKIAEAIEKATKGDN